MALGVGVQPVRNDFLVKPTVRVIRLTKAAPEVVNSGSVRKKKTRLLKRVKEASVGKVNNQIVSKQ